jgi:gamma-glutamyl:cysteine ligase YbdK (ATP-grasp superfamily)
MTSPGLFEAYGIELEYMIVDRSSLDVRPLSDRVLHSIAGAYESEVEVGELAWSNELVLHVIELKTNGPRGTLSGLAELFHRDVRRIDRILGPYGARLMPTAMHPWMDPERETRLWPHEHNEVYEAFNRIFDCRGHGWANLQSVHLNLPFRDDEEFGRLHAAIRMALPILPALAASSPFVDRGPSGLLDTRLEFYRRNCSRIPRVAGQVVPERVFTEAEYASGLLGPLYADMEPYDPEGVLRHEWLNARGAIARFDRNTIEIRLLDIQECPMADLAIVTVVTELVRALVEERWISWEAQKNWPEERLAAILSDSIREGDRAEVSDSDYLRDMGMGEAAPVSALSLWRDLVGRCLPGPAALEHSAALEVLFRDGCLSRRLLRMWSGPDSLGGIYRALCGCLAENRMLTPYV